MFDSPLVKGREQTSGANREGWWYAASPAQAGPGLFLDIGFYTRIHFCTGPLREKRSSVHLFIMSVKIVTFWDAVDFSKKNTDNLE